jgi:energy-coupling factor transporter ATP-binding protein EcfA2
MIYIKKIISQDLERTPTFNVESIRDFFKINIDNGQHIIKKIILIPSNEEFDVKFQKRETRDEYRVFLNELFQKINPKEGDVLILRKRNQEVFLCEHINSSHISYEHFNYLFEERNNHQLIVEDINNDEIASQQINLLDEFTSWFINLDGIKHNYFKDSFSENKEKLKEDLIKYEEIYNKEFKSQIFTTSLSELNILIETIQINLDKKDGDFFEYSLKKSNHMPRAILGKNNYLKFLNELNSKYSINQIEFNIELFNKLIDESGLNFTLQLLQRFVASLFTKPFVVLSGLSGSGKTKLAQAFVQWICENKEQYKIVPVGADWTNREPLLGYPNGLVAEEYITPDSGVINLLMNAVKKENQNKPFFLILDEMNLSHVERYFADFLSIMESDDTIKLYTGSKRKSLDGLEIDLEIGWPKNVFIIGTVNIDETTYMFSPKVLDRANVIEFRITNKEIKSFLENPSIPDLSKLTKQGVSMAESFLSIANTDEIVKNDDLALELVNFFKHLQQVGAEFGYRSASEIMQLVSKLKMLDTKISDNSCLDIAIMQKLLPKLHGSRSKLVKILIALSGLCIGGIATEEFEKKFDDYYKNDFEGLIIKYPISFEKIIRMYKNVLTNGFTSYAEA